MTPFDVTYSPVWDFPQVHLQCGSYSYHSGTIHATSGQTGPLGIPIGETGIPASYREYGFCKIPTGIPKKSKNLIFLFFKIMIFSNPECGQTPQITINYLQGWLIISYYNSLQ